MFDPDREREALARLDELAAEPVLLATLGSSLALWREPERIRLAEDQDQRSEVFAADRLGDAIARLYERHVELSSDGPDRARAAAIARCIATLLGPRDPDRFADTFSPDIGFIDHRAVIGLGSARGVEVLRRSLHAMFEPADDTVTRVDDVLDLRASGLLIRTTNSGTVRDGGVDYERERLQLWMFGLDGLLAQCEWFDPDRAAEARARFEDFAVVAAPARRAVIANAATAFGARVDELVAAQDGDAIEAVFAERAKIVDRKTGRRFGRDERIAGLRALLAAAREPESRHEPLAVLGPSLALLRRTLSASGFSGQTLDEGSYRIDELCVLEADEQGRLTWAELFALDRLGDAIARLYERHAEKLPEGPERRRAAVIAHAVATVLGPPDPAPIAPVLALDVEYADHRLLGWGPARGVVALVRALRTLRHALPQVEEHTIELLALRPDALLVRRAITGDLIEGGHYRRRPIALWTFGADGRVAHWEQFDGDQRELALARLEELAAPRALPQIVETAATRAIDRFDRAWASRDWSAVAALYAPAFRYSDRRALMHLELDRDAFVEFLRPLFEMKATHSWQEILATRGDRLVLFGQRFESGERDSLLLVEVDTRGDRIALVRLDPADRDGAHVELDARYAAGEASEHPAMWKALADVRRALADRKWDELEHLVAPDLVAEDHRPLGWGVARSPREYATAIRPVSELRPDVALRIDHLLVADRSALFVASWVGSDAGRAFAIPLVVVFGIGRDGRIQRAHHYNLEQIAEAHARFAELA